VLGQPPSLGCFPGGTDARLFTEYGVPALSGVGPGALVRAHQPDEYVTTGELATATQLYAGIIARYATTEVDP
jgi:acetylornithine deacetylase/succinyl-diaminopimelate desuccinylase-like protein